jgi:hypothetical protein
VDVPTAISRSGCPHLRPAQPRAGIARLLDDADTAEAIPHVTAISSPGLHPLVDFDLDHADPTLQHRRDRAAFTAGPTVFRQTLSEAAWGDPSSWWASVTTRPGCCGHVSCVRPARPEHRQRSAPTGNFRVKRTASAPWRHGPPACGSHSVIHRPELPGWPFANDDRDWWPRVPQRRSGVGGGCGAKAAREDNGRVRAVQSHAHRRDRRHPRQRQLSDTPETVHQLGIQVGWLESGSVAGRVGIDP